MNILFLNQSNRLVTFINEFKTENIPFETHRREEFNINLLHAINPQIIIIDCLEETIIPKTLIEKIRQNLNSSPIILIHNHQINFNDKYTRESCYGRIILIKYPFSFRDFLELIKTIILQIGEKSKNIKYNEKINYKDLILELKTRLVKRKERIISLRNKEYYLLKFLIENNNKILSRIDILDAVWDRNSNIFTNTIDVHMKNLRKKIDKGFRNKLIKTVYCAGYIFG